MHELAAKLDELHRRFGTAVAAAADERELEAVRIAYLGRNGEVTALRRMVGSLSERERPTAGKSINDTVAKMEEELAAARVGINERVYEDELAQTIDVTFPAIEPLLGTINPIRRIIREIGAYFSSLGFAVVVGPEIEPDYYTFDALNIPDDHPSRESFDSFWLTKSLLLRPHTSPMQIRTMQQHPPPVAILAPGKCYRRDAVDARHLFQFHQVEGLAVSTDAHFGHLKGVLTGVCRALFGQEQNVRFRPSFFPFTEPSAEVDTTCPRCKGFQRQCGMCGGSGWIELGGAGMVHPNVLRAVDYDPERYSGWAFGFGVERIGLPLYEVDDIRRFVNSDPDFLRQLQ